MNTTSVRTFPGVHHPSGRRFFVAAGGLAALGATFAMGLWLGTTFGDSTTTTTATEAEAAGAVPEAPVPPFVASHAPVDTGGVTIYLVADESQAALWGGALGDGAVARQMSGEPPLAGFEIVVLGPEGSAAEVTAMVDEGNRILAGLGMAGRTVVDLRP